MFRREILKTHTFDYYAINIHVYICIYVVICLNTLRYTIIPHSITKRLYRINVNVSCTMQLFDTALILVPSTNRSYIQKSYVTKVTTWTNKFAHYAALGFLGFPMLPSSEKCR